MKYSKKQIKQAFEEWETRVRLNPESFEDAEKTLKENVQSVSEEKANFLITIMNENK